MTYIEEWVKRRVEIYNEQVEAGVMVLPDRVIDLVALEGECATKPPPPRPEGGREETGAVVEVGASIST